MVKVRLSKQAIKDIDEIWNYTILSWNEKQADKYYNAIKREINYISKYPEIGKQNSKLDNSIRSLPVNFHTIYYRILNETSVDVLRILHQKMDINDKL